MVKIFGFLYFLFIIVAGMAFVALYYALRSKSMALKRSVLFALLISNLALHFIKVIFPPYSNHSDPLANFWFINICAASVFFFPIFFNSRSNILKDYMVYLGIISGFLAFVYPTEAMSNTENVLDLIRFYYCHGIIIIVPLLTVVLNVHKLNYRRIWSVPFIMMCMMLFIMCNQVIANELGYLSIGSDIRDVRYPNPSFIWGPTDDLAKVFTIFTPNFMKTIPSGEFIGTEKYWPFFWILPGVMIYMTVLPFMVSMIWERKHFISDIKSLFAHAVNRFKLGAKNNIDR